MKLVAIVAIVASLAFGALAGSAFAQSSPTEDAYGIQQGVDQGTSGGSSDGNGGTTDTTAAASSGSLPFTGLEVGLLALIGAGLVGTGVVVRRMSRNSGNSGPTGA